ncbi:hypothetical protein [Pedobacter polysacchareus]|uniref:hypothetical protein n=1 Tax=Pedobacter polysacchareus TaxID=2861973 RepID=UPI001C9A25DF|nr:hypothetical protein [Pedobacter polysacchareus]
MMMKRSAAYVLMIAGVTFLSACLKETMDDDRNPGCDPPSSNMFFQVQDKTSGADLFFAESPKYKINEINVYRTKDKTFKEPLRLIPVGSDIRAFSLAFDYHKPIDTLLIKIADTPIDSLFYTVKKPVNHCSPYEIENVKFNKVDLMREKGLFIFKK